MALYGDELVALRWVSLVDMMELILCPPPTEVIVGEDTVVLCNPTVSVIIMDIGE